ncbi:hypothetical protein JCM8547_003227 [Rhodosporidiobolus lusitaniae]
MPRCHAFLRLNGHPVIPHDSVDRSQRGDTTPGSVHFAYVEAEDDASVEVGFADFREEGERPEDAFVLRVLVDGNFVNGVTFIKDDNVFRFQRDDPRRVKVFEGQLGDKTCLHRIRLSRVEFVDPEDDPTAVNVQDSPSDLGTIRLSYHRVQNIRRFVEAAELEKLEGEVIWEVKPDVKGEEVERLFPSHQAHAAESITKEEQDWYAFEYIDPEEEPYFSWEWRYYSRSTLQRIGILSSSPPATPPSGSFHHLPSSSSSPTAPFRAPSRGLSNSPSISGFSSAAVNSLLAKKKAERDVLKAQLEKMNEAIAEEEEEADGEEEEEESDSSVEVSKVGSVAGWGAGEGKGKGKGRGGRKHPRMYGTNGGKGKGKKRAKIEEENGEQRSATPAETIVINSSDEA